MDYELKEKILATPEFISDLINKNWQESENLQQQIASIDTTSNLGAKVVNLLKNLNTSYYVFIGCLESLMDMTDASECQTELSEIDEIGEIVPEDTTEVTDMQNDIQNDISDMEVATDTTDDFEPFEYFVDFDEPSGEPITDKDLYNN
jgi:hypothetical protein